MAICTLTPNPSVDRTLAIDVLVPGGVHRSAAATVEAGGKGINVSRALIRHGIQSLAIVPCDPEVDPGFLDLLRKAEVPFKAIATPGPVRSNISLIEADGRTTKINEPGAGVSDDVVQRVLDACGRIANGFTWLAGCGSLPPGMDSDFYARLGDRVDETVKIAVDTSGPGLRQLLGGRCTVVKPNRRELEEMLDVTVRTIGDVVSVSRDVVADGSGPGGRGPQNMLVSLGSDGALLITPDLVVHGSLTSAEVRNTVGAGDSLLAGFLAGAQAVSSSSTGFGPECLAEALAWARASLRSETTAFAPADDVDRDAVELTAIVDNGVLVNESLLLRELVDES